MNSLNTTRIQFLNNVLPLVWHADVNFLVEQFKTIEIVTTVQQYY